MVDINVLTKGFIDLDHEKKREKLISVLDIIKNSDEVFIKLYQKVKNKYLTDSMMIVMYHDIMSFSNSVSEYKKNKDKESLEKAKQSLMNMKQLEKIDREKDLEDIKDIEDIIEKM